ncbi:hypothetical protein B9Z55_018079 [Caenorhabditis nigoni]|uniref:TAZ-type domain-containing protein n=1 Tax=Caenorhabditis nigoni TaxID=1611254 RepID=A0A2G5TCI0_9PELO|nr:hypothetical protein B9Z55_018079 [Caenorhabditis nigoni]
MASTSSQKTSEDVEDTEEDLKKLVSENKEEEEVGECSSEEGSKEQTTTGQKKLLPPTIRIGVCRCVQCSSENVYWTCKTCCQYTMFCQKCARKARHPHTMKRFRESDRSTFLLQRHLQLVYYNHIVSCDREICLEPCLKQREYRVHFDTCPCRPRSVHDIIVDGQVRFDGTGFTHEDCVDCGLYITCLFLHANDCKAEQCPAQWCNEMREVFDMDSKQIWMISDEMKKKVKDVIIEEWKKVRERQQVILVRGIVDDLLALTV